MTALHYFVDPMCSWCYAFAPEMKEIIRNLPDGIELHYVMGGLAPDSDEPMSPEVQEYVQNAWRAVAARTGATFNFDFWTRCQPRRSTYPACRAVIAAGLQGQDNIPLMIEAIQQAYYRQARNPSDKSTLIEIAAEIGLDSEQFKQALNSSEVEDLLQTDFGFKYRLGIQGFPTLVLEKDGKYYALTIGYTKVEVVLSRLQGLVG